ncbi:MAG TPA: ABC transporter substrate-binding protein, partial [Anaerolineaceae bacterium]|nr:ABC transporter substrate-binding protein [Anaerolineaceae bacterium]
EATEPPAEPEAPAEPVELVIWNTWADHHVTAFQELLDEFNAAHPGITVIQQAQPLTDYEGKLMQAVRQGAGPDLVTTFATVAANYINEGMIVNLSEYIDDPEIGLPNFKESISEGVYQEITQWDGNVYMMPMFTGGEVFYYNQTLFDELGVEVPTTWAELEETGRTITEATGKPAFGFDNEIDGFQVLIMQNGSGYINPETKTVEYNNEIAVEQLEWFCGLVEEGVFRLVGEDVYFSNPFGSQAVASYIGSAAGYGFVESAVNGQFEFNVAPIPQGGTKEYISNWGGGWMIFTTTEAKQRAAWEFIKFMSSPEILARWGVAFGGVPAYPAAIEQPVFQEFMATNPAIQAQSEQIHRVGSLSAIQGSAAIRTVIGRAVTSACTGQMTAEEALTRAEEEGNLELQAAQ